jgi:uncharacterized membrane protein YfcA
VPATLVQHLVTMALLGVAAATIGSLAGLGGGFIVAPALRIFFDVPPDEAAATSLVFVLANVMSATVAFVRQGRVDLRLALVVGIAAIPTSILGAFAVHGSNATFFDLVYAGILAFFAATLLRRSDRLARGRIARLPFSHERLFRDRVSDTTYRYAESLPVATGTGLVTGFLSSFFGIGGGTVVVPVLLRFFAMPAHIVSATSHTIILLSAPFGVAAHVYAGDVVWQDAVPLTVGGLAGGQAGAFVSKRLSGIVLVRIVAFVLTAAALSLFAQHVGSMLVHGRVG